MIRPALSALHSTGGQAGMTGLAERTQVGPHQPKVRTPDNRDDVVHIRSSHDQALLGAEAAQRLLGQHLFTQPLPIRAVSAGRTVAAPVIQGAELITTGLGWWRKEGRPVDGRANRHPHPQNDEAPEGRSHRGVSDAPMASCLLI